MSDHGFAAYCQLLTVFLNSVVGSQWSRIHKDALRSAHCYFLSALIGVNLRLIWVFILGID